MLSQDDIYITTLWAEAVKLQAEADDAQRAADYAATIARGAAWNVERAVAIARAAEDRRQRGDRVIPTDEERAQAEIEACRLSRAAEEADRAAHQPTPIVGVDMRARKAVGANVGFDFGPRIEPPGTDYYVAAVDGDTFTLGSVPPQAPGPATNHGLVTGDGPIAGNAADLIASGQEPTDEDKRQRRILGGISFAVPSHLVGDQSGPLTTDDFVALGQLALGDVEGCCDHDGHNVEDVGRRVADILARAGEPASDSHTVGCRCDDIRATPEGAAMDGFDEDDDGHHPDCPRFYFGKPRDPAVR